MIKAEGHGLPMIQDMNPEVAKTFERYSSVIRNRLLFLRQLILRTASGMDGMSAIEESLKWGEPSYRSRFGSPIRLGWKAALPEQYGLYFNCNTSLVDTFRERFADQLRFEGNRAILFQVDEKLPVEAVTVCIERALDYHRIKHLPMLGL